MARKATLFNIRLQVSDLDRHHYADYSLRLARHPSETDPRLMVRLLAFALYADERLRFTRGLCVDDEPDLWRHAHDGEIELWIEVGLPDLRRMRRACGRAREVVVIAYDARRLPRWWAGVRSHLCRFDNLRVWSLAGEAPQQLAQLARRTLSLQVTLQEGVMWWSSEQRSVTVTLEPLYPAP